jgi:membrane-associated phospholipid phosphatase
MDQRVERNVGRFRRLRLRNSLEGLRLPRLLLLLALLLPARADAKDAVDIVADTMQYLVPAVGLGNTLYRKDSDGLKQFAISGGVMAATTVTLKYSINAKRPSGGGQSFPSGHSATVAWGTGFLQKRYGWRWALPGYAAMGYVMWARVENDHHYVRDVVGGAAIGFLSGYLLSKRYEFAGHPVDVSPMPEGIGLRISGVW